MTGNRKRWKAMKKWLTGADPLAVLKGTVNDATDFPTPSKSHGSYHWAFERLLSASLIPVMGAAAVSTGSAYVRLVHSLFLSPLSCPPPSLLPRLVPSSQHPRYLR